MTTEAMNLTMELVYDSETGHWAYAVPALSIVGTGCRSKEEALRLGEEAIRFVLESEDPPPSPDAEVVRFRVELIPAG